MMWIGTAYGQEDLNFQIQEGLRAEEHKRLVKLAKGVREDGAPGSLQHRLSASWSRIEGLVQARSSKPSEPQQQCC